MERKGFWSFSPAELVMDLILILYSSFFSKFLYTNTDLIFSFSPTAIYIFLVLLAMFMPWYMGVVFARYRYVYGWVVAIIPLIIMIFSLSALSSVLFSFNEQAITDFAITEQAGPLYAVCVILLLIYIGRAFYIGFKTEKDMMKGNSFDIENEEHIRFFFLSFSLSAAFVFCLLYFAGEVSETTSSGYNSVFAVLASLGCALGFSYAGIKILKRLQTYFPVFIITLLLCWSGLLEGSFIEGMKLVNGEVDNDVLIILLIFTGVIPFRLVLLFSPPLRGINLLIGISAMICYFYFLS